MTIEEIERLSEAAKREQAENDKKMIHNRSCSLDDIQPYENKSLIEFSDAVMNLVDEVEYV